MDGVAPTDGDDDDADNGGEDVIMAAAVAILRLRDLHITVDPDRD